MAAWRYEFSLLARVEKYFTRSLRSLVKYSSTLEEKFRISARPCNISSIYYIDIDEIPGFLLLLKDHIFTALSEHIIFIFHM